MATVVSEVTRLFKYNGVQLPDPGEGLSTEAVRDLYSTTYPEIVSAAVDGPSYEGDSVVYTYVRAVRDKG